VRVRNRWGEKKKYGGRGQKDTLNGLNLTRSELPHIRRGGKMNKKWIMTGLGGAKTNERGSTTHIKKGPEQTKKITSTRAWQKHYCGGVGNEHTKFGSRSP